MSVGSLCKRGVITIRPDEDLAAAARLMREKHVGYLVVVDGPRERALTPRGVLTDRDIVVEGVAMDVNPRTLTVGDVMAREPLVVEENGSVKDALAQMREIGVRRAPVVSGDGELVGVLSVDDVLDDLADRLLDIAGLIRNEQRTERKVRRT